MSTCSVDVFFGSLCSRHPAAIVTLSMPRAQFKRGSNSDKLNGLFVAHFLQCARNRWLDSNFMFRGRQKANQMNEQFANLRLNVLIWCCLIPGVSTGLSCFPGSTCASGNARGGRDQISRRKVEERSVFLTARQARGLLYFFGGVSRRSTAHHSPDQVVTFV